MKDLTNGKPAKLILNFAAPMLLGNLFQQLYNVVDSIVVGKFIGTDALAAVGASFYIIFALISLIIGIATGGTIVISQYFGAKNYERVSATINTLFIFLFFAAISLSVLGIVFSEQIFRLINLEESVIPSATDYLNTYLYGLVTIFGFNALNAILRGMGDSRTPLVFTIAATVLNIVLDIYFVKGLGYGIKSVALATVIAHAVTFFGGLLYLNKNHDLFSLNIRKWVFDRPLFAKISKIGLPTGVQMFFVAFGMVFLTGIINRFGTNVMAAFAGASKIDALAILPAMTFAQSLGTYVGQNIGANKMDRVVSGMKATLFMSSAICIVITILIMIFGTQLMTLFVDKSSTEVIRIGKEYLVIVSMFYLVFNAMFTFHGVLRGAGDTLIPMFITLISLWGLRIPIAHLLSNKIGEEGIWWAIPLAWFFGMCASYIYYRTGNWKTKSVVKHGRV